MSHILLSLLFMLVLSLIMHSNFSLNKSCILLPDIAVPPSVSDSIVITNILLTVATNSRLKLLWYILSLSVPNSKIVLIPILSIHLKHPFEHF